MKDHTSALSVLNIIAIVTKILCSIGFFSLCRHFWKKHSLKRRYGIRISMRILKMTIDPLCIIQQIIRTEFLTSVPTEHELEYLDQIVSKQLIPTASQLEEKVSRYGKCIRKSLGGNVWKQLDMCLQAVVATSDWHYPIKPYMKLESDSRKACMEILDLWKLILVDKKLQEWGKNLMQECCSQRGIPDMISLLDIK